MEYFQKLILNKLKYSMISNDYFKMIKIPEMLLIFFKAPSPPSFYFSAFTYINKIFYNFNEQIIYSRYMYA